jgi:hypothetical protein
VVRWEHTAGRVDTSQSLGSVVRSRNAPPLPRVTLSTEGYVPVPGTGARLSAQCHIEHDWLESDRFVEGAFLHEKSLYLRFLSPEFPVTVHAGITHHVQWGSTHRRRGSQASSLGEWADVVFLSGVFTED